MKKLLLSGLFKNTRQGRRCFLPTWRYASVPFALLLCLLVRADFNPPSWRYRRPLTVTPPANVSEFIVDAATYRNSAANLDDLRILRDGTETPYFLETLAGSREVLEPPVSIINKAWTPDAGVQAVLDLKRHSEHNRLRIETPLHNYKQNVRIETSDDAHKWAVVNADGIIFDVLRDDHAVSETTVTYPTSTRRYLRLTIPGWKNPENLSGVWLSALKETGATRYDIATLTPQVHEDPKSQTTELILDVGFAGQPVDRIALSVDPGLFSRAVEISSSNDQQRWDSIAGGAIYRTADGEDLSLDTPDRTERYLKIVVFNADSAPLHFGPITLSGIRRVVKFASAQAGSYFVYLGNPNARTPSYDFARVLPPSTVPVAAKLGDVEANPAFHLPERPWTDRHPWLLNSTLVIAVIAMGVVTLRMMRKIG